MRGGPIIKILISITMLLTFNVAGAVAGVLVPDQNFNYRPYASGSLWNFGPEHRRAARSTQAQKATAPAGMTGGSIKTYRVGQSYTNTSEDVLVRYLKAQAQYEVKLAAWEAKQKASTLKQSRQGQSRAAAKVVRRDTTPGGATWGAKYAEHRMKVERVKKTAPQGKSFVERIRWALFG